MIFLENYKNPGLYQLLNFKEIYLCAVPIDNDTSAQHPPRSDLAKRFRKYLKYRCSSNNNSAASIMPAISSRKADKNCFSANGSDVLCSCFPGRHCPDIQYRLNRSRSPFERSSNNCRLNILRYLEFLLKPKP